MKRYSLILSIGFFTAMAMDDSLSKKDEDFWDSLYQEEEDYSLSDKEDNFFGWSSIYDAPFNYEFTGNDVPALFDCGARQPGSVTPASAIEETNENEKVSFYANCPECCKFFSNPEKKTVAEMLREHCFKIHRTVPSSDNALSAVRTFMGYWEVESCCPYAKNNDSSYKMTYAKLCRYKSKNFIKCDGKKKPYYPLVEHLKHFHLQNGISGILLIKNGNVNIKNICEIKPQKLSQKRKRVHKPSVDELLLNGIEKKVTCTITYSCPFHGVLLESRFVEGSRPGARKVCDILGKKLVITDYKESIEQKIYGMIAERYRHLKCYHTQAMNKSALPIPSDPKEMRKYLKEEWMNIEYKEN